MSRETERGKGYGGRAGDTLTGVRQGQRRGIKERMSCRGEG